MNNLLVVGSTDSTGSTFAALAGDLPVRGRHASPKAPAPKTVNAVYGYIRSVRALGRDSVNTADISKALALPQSEVDRAVALLRDRGVKRQGRWPTR